MGGGRDVAVGATNWCKIRAKQATAALRLRTNFVVEWRSSNLLCPTPSMGVSPRQAFAMVVDAIQRPHATGPNQCSCSVDAIMVSGSCGAIAHSFKKECSHGWVFAAALMSMPFLVGTHMTLSINACAKALHDKNLTERSIWLTPIWHPVA